METQLLCTFSSTDELEQTIDDIYEKYNVVSRKIFVLDNLEDDEQVILTYNVFNADTNDVLESTISVHRKKKTNTIYSINALNNLIIQENDGILDKRFRVDWSELENMVLVTAHGNLKKIPTQIREIRNG